MGYSTAVAELTNMMRYVPPALGLAIYACPYPNCATLTDQVRLVHDIDEVMTELVDLKRDEWTTVILPILRKMPISLLMRESGLSRATIQVIRAGRRPYKKNMERLVALRFARGKT